MFCLLHLLHTHLLAAFTKGTQTHFEGELKGGACKCVCWGETLFIMRGRELATSSSLFSKQHVLKYTVKENKRKRSAFAHTDDVPIDKLVFIYLYDCHMTDAILSQLRAQSYGCPAQNLWSSNKGCFPAARKLGRSCALLDHCRKQAVGQCTQQQLPSLYWCRHISGRVMPGRGYQRHQHAPDPIPSLSSCPVLFLSSGLCQQNGWYSSVVSH